MNEHIWGQHLILDMSGCCIKAVSDSANIINFSKELVQAIDMKAFGDPILKHFATQNPDASGYTLVQLIETSSITAHFAELSGEIYLDVFSCKVFNENLAIEVCKKFFSPHKIKRTSLKRGVKPNVSNAA